MGVLQLNRLLKYIMFLPVLALSLLVLTVIAIPGYASGGGYYYYYVAPPEYLEWQEAREEVTTLVETIGVEELIAGVGAEEIGVEFDVNNDGVVDLGDAYLILKDAGLIKVDPPKLPASIAQAILKILEAIYGPGLVNYPSIDGRIYLLYMLGYLPYM